MQNAAVMLKVHVGAAVLCPGRCFFRFTAMSPRGVRNTKTELNSNSHIAPHHIVVVHIAFIILPVRDFGARNAPGKRELRPKDICSIGI